MVVCKKIMVIIIVYICFISWWKFHLGSTTSQKWFHFM